MHRFSRGSLAPTAQLFFNQLLRNRQPSRITSRSSCERAVHKKLCVSKFVATCTLPDPVDIEGNDGLIQPVSFGMLPKLVPYYGMARRAQLFVRFAPAWSHPRTG